MAPSRLAALRSSLGSAFSTSTGRRYVDGFVAVVLFVLTQLLICGLHRISPKKDLPAPILAMIMVAALMIVLSWIVKGVDDFYRRFLSRPTDLLNKHMSVGFIVPFVTILKDPAQAKEVGIIMIGFIVTGVLNSAMVYFAAQAVQTAITLAGRKIEELVVDEKQTRASETPDIRIERPEFLLPSPTFVYQECRYKPSNLSNSPSIPYTSDNEGETLGTITPTPAPESAHINLSSSSSSTVTPKKPHTLLAFVEHNPIFTLTLLTTPLVGLPLALAAGITRPLDTLLLTLLWTGTLAAQHTLKFLPCFSNHEKTRTFLTSSLNPVLWTSLLMIAYIAIKTHIIQTNNPNFSVGDTLKDFETKITFADLIHGYPPNIGAGDIAISILNAGLVVWGLKLFECRAQLLSKAGMTILVVSCGAAGLNVVCGPLLLWAMGLSRGRALAFAARSVTLALAGPAMDALEGDKGLNAAMVVFNGIVFQMGMGFGVVGWADRRWQRWKGMESGADLEKQDAGGSNRRRQESEGGSCFQSERREGRQGSEASQASFATVCDSSDVEDGLHDQPRTVATGVAVGINAAAMGTAYLYEHHERVAPYAALSMTVFGVLTVGLTSIPQLTLWLTTQVS